MAYTALYRKYRPNNFSSVVGQEHISKTLKNQVAQNKFSHAYLFCGTRGTGKTSCAKILARAINCSNRVDGGEPCNECDMCKSILKGSSVNVIEIDAASNNGVDDMRSIREEIKYPPTSGFYKVYIIDEVHALSKSAFNAILKTLEEPPEYVVFILATTDPQKILPTIRSRCQRFDFKRITEQNIGDTLKKYLSLEGEDIDDDAIGYIASLGDGSMRDSLSILDKCIAVYSKEHISHEKVIDLLGAVDQDVMFDLTRAICSKNVNEVMNIIDDITISGRDIVQFISEYITHLRNFLMVSSMGDANRLLDISAKNKTKFVEMKEFISVQEAIKFIQEFSKMQNDFKYALNPRILLEVELLRLCSDWNDLDNTSIMAKMARMEREIKTTIENTVKLQASQVVLERKPEHNDETQKEIQEEPKVVRRPKAVDADLHKLKADWQKIRNSIGDATLKATIKISSLKFKDDGKIYLICDNEINVDMLERRKSEIVEAIEKEIDREIEIGFMTHEKYNKWYDDNFDISQEEAEVEACEEFEKLSSLLNGVVVVDDIDEVDEENEENEVEEVEEVNEVNEVSEVEEISEVEEVNEENEVNEVEEVAEENEVNQVEHKSDNEFEQEYPQEIIYEDYSSEFNDSYAVSEALLNSIYNDEDEE